MAGTGKLDGRMALITGGSRGIGAAIGRALAAEGADVAFCHNDDDVGVAEVEADPVRPRPARLLLAMRPQRYGGGAQVVRRR
jgi:NAD(P)-dependent dehydrogenase (short-subunit alcohol dehydrogenase family)